MRLHEKSLTKLNCVLEMYYIWALLDSIAGNAYIYKKNTRDNNSRPPFIRPFYDWVTIINEVHLPSLLN